jgi:hypothetical protein
VLFVRLERAARSLFLDARDKKIQREPATAAAAPYNEKEKGTGVNLNFLPREVN